MHRQSRTKEVWHYNGPFHIETGEPLYEMTEEDYSDISMNYLLDKMKKRSGSSSDYIRNTDCYGIHRR